MYDDGGLSGGTLERPALKRILADIEGHRIDTVVVYKVDRLTRSLGDFAKIVEIFDKRKVSFVSVTQQFNTTTSMGRLTLNMLLSFAQFEREVTGERIRDKIAASKKKGMWMGGNVPLGYVVKERKLLIDEAEAKRVRHIYRRYVTLGSVRSLKEELERDGVVSKVRVDRYGRATGGKPLARGALYTMLQNRIYRGRIVHKDKHYPGAHEAIVDEALWDEVQRQLAANRIACASGTHAAEPSLLAGLIYDDGGQRMTPSHANKKGTRYRYYVSQALVSGIRRSAPRARRVPAGDVERLVQERLTVFLKSQGEIFDAVEPLFDDVNRRQQVVDLAADLAARWPDLEPATKRRIFERLVNRINLTQETLEIRIAPGPVAGDSLGRGQPKNLRASFVGQRADRNLHGSGASQARRNGDQASDRRRGRQRTKIPGSQSAQTFEPGAALPRNGAAQPGQDDDGACHRGGRRGVLLHPDPAAQLPRTGGREDHPPGPPSARADREEACRRHAPANRMGRTARPVRDHLSQGIGCCPTAAPR